MRDHDDIVQEYALALIAGHRPCRWRLHDAMKRVLGRTRGNPVPSVIPAVESTDAATVAAAVDEWAVDDRSRVLLTGLAYGWNKSEAAEHLGVHPSRVSQLLAAIRKANK